MVPTLSAGWNVALLIMVAICIVIVVTNVRRETQERKDSQETSVNPQEYYE